LRPYQKFTLFKKLESFFYLITEAYLKLTRVSIALEPNREINFRIEQKVQFRHSAIKKRSPNSIYIRENRVLWINLYGR